MNWRELKNQSFEETDDKHLYQTNDVVGRDLGGTAVLNDDHTSNDDLDDACTTWIFLCSKEISNILCIK